MSQDIELPDDFDLTAQEEADAINDSDYDDSTTDNNIIPAAHRIIPIPIPSQLQRTFHVILTMVIITANSSSGAN